MLQVPIVPHIGSPPLLLYGWLVVDPITSRIDHRVSQRVMMMMMMQMIRGWDMARHTAGRQAIKDKGIVYHRHKVVVGRGYSIIMSAHPHHELLMMMMSLMPVEIH